MDNIILCLPYTIDETFVVNVSSKEIFIIDSLIRKSLKKMIDSKDIDDIMNINKISCESLNSFNSYLNSYNKKGTTCEYFLDTPGRVNTAIQNIVSLHDTVIILLDDPIVSWNKMKHHVTFSRFVQIYSSFMDYIYYISSKCNVKIIETSKFDIKEFYNIFDIECDYSNITINTNIVHKKYTKYVREILDNLFYNYNSLTDENN